MTGYIVQGKHLGVVHRTDVCAKNRSLGTVIEVGFKHYRGPHNARLGVLDHNDPGFSPLRRLCNVCWRGEKA